MGKRQKQVRQAEITKAFAKRLRAIRNSKELTQRDLAERATVTLSYVSKLEAGGATPGIDLVERLAKALQVQIVDLLPLPTDAGTDQEHVRALFEAVMSKGGPETLGLLNLFLARLADSAELAR